MALSAAKRKEKSRQEQRDKGLVRFHLGETWGSPAQKVKFDIEVDKLIAEILSNPA